MTPEAVIFDIGNVLTRWQPEAFYDRVIGEERRRALFAAVDLHQNLLRACLPDHCGGLVRVQHRCPRWVGTIAVVAVDGGRATANRNLQQIEPVQLSGCDQGFRAILNVIQRQPFPGHMGMARVHRPAPDGIQPMRAKHRRHAIPRLVQIGGLKQHMRAQRLRANDLHALPPRMATGQA